MTPPPREWPLILSARDVLAVLGGTKTSHRRPVRPGNSTVLGRRAARYWPHIDFAHAAPRGPVLAAPCREYGDPTEPNPYDLDWLVIRPKWSPGADHGHDGHAGTLLWVKEQWAPDRDGPGPDAVVYRADGPARGAGGWQPAALLPRRACRLTLAVTAVAPAPAEAAGGCGWDWVTDFTRIKP